MRESLAACALIVGVCGHIYAWRVSNPDDLSGFGASARVASMGNAFTSVADSPSALLYNPAGLIQLSKPQINAFYTPLFASTKCGAFELAVPTRKFGVFGFGWINLVSDGFESRVGPEQQAEEFKVTDQLGVAGYSLRVMKYLSLGLNVKMLKKQVFTQDGASFAADAGILSEDFSRFAPQEKTVLYRGSFFIEQLKKMSFGFFAQNIVPPTLKLKSVEEKYSLVTRWAISWLMLRQKERSLMLSYDLEDRLYPDKIHHFGAEYTVNKFAALRMGFQQQELSFGFGINYDNYLFDYAFTLKELGALQRFSLGMRFGHTMDELQNIRKTNIEKMTKKKAKLLSHEYYLQGVDLYNGKKYKQAIKSWDKAVIWDPENYKADEMADKAKQLLEALEKAGEKENHLLMAHALYSQGKFTRSLEEWEWIKNKYPEDKTADEYIKKIKNQIAISVEERKKYEEEKKSRNEGKIELLTEEGWARFKEADYRKAIEVWQDIFNIDYNHQKTLENIALARRQMNDELEKELGLATAMLRENRNAEAVTHFQKVLKLDPDNAHAAKSLETLKKELLIQRQSDSVDLKHIDRLYFMAANSYLEGNYARAKEIIAEIKLLDPLNENAVKLEYRIDNISAEIKKSGGGNGNGKNGSSKN